MSTEAGWEQTKNVSSKSQGSARRTSISIVRSEKRQRDIDDSAIEVILDYIDSVKSKFNSFEVFNRDQSGFAYTVCTNRTLSY